MNELRVDIGGSNRGFQMATEQTKRMAQDLQRSLEGYTPDTFKGAQMMRDKYGKAFDGVKGGASGLFETITGGLGAAGQGIMSLAMGPVGVLTAAFWAAKSAVSSAYETMKESFDLAREAGIIGITTTGLQRIRESAEEQGIDSNETSSRLYRFTSKVGEAAQGDKMAKNFFKDMGVEIEGRNMEQILTDVAGAFDKIKDPAQRAYSATQLFGRGGQEMIPILAQLKEGGGLLAAAGISDEQTDAVLAGSWKKIHGFFSDVSHLAKRVVKEGISDFVEGYTGYTGDDQRKIPQKVKIVETTEQKAAKAAAAAKHDEALGAAQKQYRAELEATTDAENRMLMLMQDERDLKEQIANSKDDVETVKLKTELLRKQKELEESKNALQKDWDAKHKPAEIHKRSLGSSHVDSLSGAGLFTSSGAMNTRLETLNEKQLTELQNIHQAIVNRRDIFT